MSSSSKVVTVIPARISSTRLKEKPLADLGGKPLIQRVWENAVSNPSAGEVVVATDAEKIKKTVENFGGKCVMTPESLNSGSDRVYYTARKYYPDAQIVVNLQGDEPFIDQLLVRDLIQMAGRESYGLYSAYFSIDSVRAAESSTVKVVINEKREALYFSRALIPDGGSSYKKHIGIYVWKRAALEKFFNTRPTSLEKAEKLEQLRVLESGDKIKMAKSANDSPGIDTPADLKEAEKYLNDKK